MDKLTKMMRELERAATQQKTTSEYVIELIVWCGMLALFGWWLSWILPHFGVNLGFWLSVATVTVASIAVQKYKYLITVALAIPTIAIWAGFATH